jgi:hypothetical protein
LSQSFEPMLQSLSQCSRETESPGQAGRFSSFQWSCSCAAICPSICHRAAWPPEANTDALDLPDPPGDSVSRGPNEPQNEIEPNWGTQEYRTFLFLHFKSGKVCPMPGAIAVFAKSCFVVRTAGRNMLRSKKDYAQYLQYALLCARCVSKDFTVTLTYEDGEKCVKKMKLTVELTNKWYAQYLKLRGKRARLSRGRFGQRVTLKRADILKMPPMDVAIFAYGLLHVSRKAQGALKEKAAQMGNELLGCARGKPALTFCNAPGCKSGSLFSAAQGTHVCANCAFEDIRGELSAMSAVA